MPLFSHVHQPFAPTRAAPIFIRSGEKNARSNVPGTRALLCLACSSRRIAREVGILICTGYRWCWWLRNVALSYEMHRRFADTVEADELYHTAGHNRQAKQGGIKPLGRRPHRRRKKREPGRGHYDKDRPAMIAWVSRQGPIVVHAVKDFTVKAVQQAAALAVQAGGRLYTDSASSYQALEGYVHAFANHARKEYARGDVHENRAECLFSLLKPYLRVFHGIGKCNLPGSLGFFNSCATSVSTMRLSRPS
jgi:transposase